MLSAEEKEERKIIMANAKTLESFPINIPDHLKLDYRDDLKPWQWAWAFLRRNKDFQNEASEYKEKSGQWHKLPSEKSACEKWRLTKFIDFKVPACEFLEIHWDSFCVRETTETFLDNFPSIKTQYKRSNDKKSYSAEVISRDRLILIEGKYINLPKEKILEQIEYVLDSWKLPAKNPMPNHSGHFPAFLKIFDLKEYLNSSYPNLGKEKTWEEITKEVFAASNSLNADIVSYKRNTRRYLQNAKKYIDGGYKDLLRIYSR